MNIIGEGCIMKDEEGDIIFFSFGTLSQFLDRRHLSE
jgi:hypothetical protein